MYYGVGFTHSDVYTMPTYLRGFYYQELVGTKKDEKDKIDKANRRAKPKFSKPAINPRFKR